MNARAASCVALIAALGCNQILGHEHGIAGIAPTAIDDASRWTFVDPSATDGHDFAGSAFDGRYVYFASASPDDGTVARYDTQAAFDDDGAWDSVDLTTFTDGAHGFLGAVFDGRYVTIVPHATPTPSSLVARFDTTGTFDDAAAWTFHDLAAIDGARGFAGAATDGRFVYLVPSFDFSGRDGIVTRFDTTLDFDSDTSWTTFDMSTITLAARGYFGAIFDGRSLYFVPAENGGPQGVVVRFDTTLAFTDASSWTAFDVSAVNPTLLGFAGGTFDGQYVYLAPTGKATTLVTRYDTHAAFDDVASWATFDAQIISGHAFAGAESDGRYVYLIPTADAILVRYDTTLAFGSPSAWEGLDLAGLDGAARPFRGGGFDDAFIYLVPSSGGPFARFLARSPAATSTSTTSFF